MTKNNLKMNKNEIPHLLDDIQNNPNVAFDFDDQQLWDNTLMDGLHEIEVSETIQKIRNYYNGHHNIDGRPPSRKDFNEFLDMIEKIN